MPIFEYYCSNCQSNMEELIEGFNPPDSFPCPECDEGHMIRVITPPTIVYKGSGFTKKVEKDDNNSG